MLNELDKYIENIAVDIAQQRGINFSTHKEAQHYLNRTKNEIHSHIQQGNTQFCEGLKYLQEKNHGYVHGYVSNVCDKLLAHAHSSKKIKKIIDEVMENELSLRFFTEAVKEFQDCGDYHKELCVIAVLMSLFPANPQAYICLGNLIWRKEGVAAADLFYTKIIEFVQDPATYYFAADCFYKNGDRKKAKETLLNALSKPDIDEDFDAKQRLLDLLEKC